MARLSAQKQVQRDARIVSDRARGFGWAAIAERHGLSERRCHEIWSTYWATQPSLGEIDPVEAVNEAIAQHDALVEDLARLAETSTQDAVRLGVLKAKREAMRERLILMQAVGLLPRDLGLLKHEVDVRRIIQVFMAALDRHDLPEVVEDDLLEALRAGSIRREYATEDRPDEAIEP
jgi:hypothetical protein